MLQSTAAITAFVLLGLFDLAYLLTTYKKYKPVGIAVNIFASLVAFALLFLQLWWPYMVFILITQPLLYWLPLKKIREGKERKMSFGMFLLSLVTALTIFYGVYGLLNLLNGY